MVTGVCMHFLVSAQQRLNCNYSKYHMYLSLGRLELLKQDQGQITRGMRAMYLLLSPRFTRPPSRSMQFSGGLLIVDDLIRSRTYRASIISCF